MKFLSFAVIVLFLLAAFLYNYDSNSRYSETANSVRHPSSLQEMLKSSLTVFELMRNDIGVYYDNLNLKDPLGNTETPCSIASIGMALVSLAIADNLKLNADAEVQAEKSLAAISGNLPGFNPGRNKINGFYYHWINMTTGERAWNSEYSSIDSALLVTGALFAKTYFKNNKNIAFYADQIFMSIDWDQAIANKTTGEIFMVFNEDGSGSQPLKAFNEYMIVAWMCNNAPHSKNGKQMWQSRFKDPGLLPKVSYEDIELLTDGMWPIGNKTNILSNFCIQFTYYLCSYFNKRSDFGEYFKNAWQADKLWFEKNTGFPSYAYGTGAGVQPDGYAANNFLQNKYQILSPQILAGFIPLDPNILDNLDLMMANQIGVNVLPNTNISVLWRTSGSERDWKPDNIGGVDWSTMIFGLASHPDALGFEFFRKYSDFDFPSGIGKNISSRAFME